MDTVEIRITVKDNIEQEFEKTLVEELKDLQGFITLQYLKGRKYSLSIVNSSSAYYVLTRWADKGFIDIETGTSKFKGASILLEGGLS